MKKDLKEFFEHDIENICNEYSKVYTDDTQRIEALNRLKSSIKQSWLHDEITLESEFYLLSLIDGKLFNLKEKGE